FAEGLVRMSTSLECGLVCHATTLAAALAGEGRAQQALAEVRGLIRARAGGYRQLLVAEGDARFHLRDVAGALRSWRRALRGDLGTGTLRWRMGLARLALRDAGGAAEDFAEAQRQ